MPAALRVYNLRSVLVCSLLLCPIVRKMVIIFSKMKPPRNHSSFLQFITSLRVIYFSSPILPVLGERGSDALRHRQDGPRVRRGAHHWVSRVGQRRDIVLRPLRVVELQEIVI